MKRLSYKLMLFVSIAVILVGLSTGELFLISTNQLSGNIL